MVLRDTKVKCIDKSILREFVNYTKGSINVYSMTDHNVGVNLILLDEHQLYLRYSFQNMLQIENQSATRVWSLAHHCVRPYVAG